MTKYMTFAVALVISMLASFSAYAGEWKQDQTGYWYEETNGEYVASAWKQIDGAWYYFNETGYMQTGWLKEGETWYYLEPGTGAMVADKEVLIDGETYYFDASGAMAETAPAESAASTPSTGWNGNTFVSTRMNYQVTVPAAYQNMDPTLFDGHVDYESVVCEIAVTSTSNEVALVSVYYPGLSMVSASEMATTMATILAGENSIYTIRDQGQTVLGGGSYEYICLSLGEILYQDLYIKKEGSDILLIQLVYLPGRAAEAAQIVSSIANVQ